MFNSAIFTGQDFLPADMTNRSSQDNKPKTKILEISNSGINLSHLV
jgi:hypothetical protein